MKYSCVDCMYSNFNEDGAVVCDKKSLLNGRTIAVDKDKVDKKCTAHSSYYIEDWRYGANLHNIADADDACEVCGRLLDMFDEDSYEYVEEEFLDDNKDEQTREVRKCKICIDKGRVKFEKK